ncbi:MAG: hypothetical protein Q4P29_07540 [Tissierellia bacterium]|nr:hypothetical protein [Tissierellia bacterium]
MKLNYKFEKENLISYILIILMFITQLFYKNIPGAYFLSLLLGPSVIAFYMLRNKKSFAKIIILFAIFLSYLLFIFTKYRIIYLSLNSLAALWLIIIAVFYIGSKENFVDTMKQRLIRILIAAVYFGIIYFSIFLIVTLANTIFNANIDYYSWPFRLANAVAWTLALCILMLDYKDSKAPSSFFIAIVGKILPIASIIIATLSIIMIVQKKLGLNITIEFYSYYFIFALFFLSFLLSEIADTNQKLRRIVAVLMGISILSYSMLLEGYFMRYGILINIIVAAWLFYYAFKAQKADYKLGIMIIILAAIIFLPPFGFMVSDNFQEEIAWDTTQTPAIKIFNQNTDVSMENENYISANFSKEYMGLISIEDYSQMASNINIYDKMEGEILQFGNYKLYSKDGKILNVDTGKKIYKFDVFTKSKELESIDDKNNEANEKYQIKFEGEDFMLEITNYHYSNVLDKADTLYFNIALNLYLK